jgi:hypothetical protein
VLVRLVTPFASLSVPPVPLSLPAHLTRDGLAAVVRHLLGDGTCPDRRVEPTVITYVPLAQPPTRILAAAW